MFRNQRPKHAELNGIINKTLLLHLVGYLHYVYQRYTVKVYCRIILQWQCSYKQYCNSGSFFCLTNNSRVLSARVTRYREPLIRPLTLVTVTWYLSGTYGHRTMTT